ncbi:MAG: hypothetical protein WA977_06755 [Halobacteriota archaeon]
MEEKTVKGLWIAITAVVVAIAAVAFGTALGWSARVLLMPVILGIIIANLSVVLWVEVIKMEEKMNKQWRIFGMWWYLSRKGDVE